MAESKAEAPKAEAPKAEAPKAQGFGSKLDEAKAKTEEKDREKKQVARARVNREEKLKSAYAKGEGMTLGEAIDGFMRSADNELMAGQTAIAAITQVLGYEGWADMTNAGSNGNLAPVWARREEIRKGIARRAFLAGHANKDMPWSRLCRLQREYLSGGNKNTREPKPVSTVAKAMLTSLYRKYERIEEPTEAELAIGRKVGQMLIADFKVDLSTIK